MSIEAFRTQIATLTAALAGRPLDAELETWLNLEHGSDSPTFKQLQQSCQTEEAS